VSIENVEVRMQLSSFNPENELELAISRAKEGALSIEELLQKLVQSDLYVSSKAEVNQDGSGFEPLLVGDSANPLVAVFSSLSRPGLHRHMAEYVLQMSGREFFARLPASYGVALNPGYESQLVISSDVASRLGRN
jgi:hypothetical protein